MEKKYIITIDDEEVLTVIFPKGTDDGEVLITLRAIRYMLTVIHHLDDPEDVELEHVTEEIVPDDEEECQLPAHKTW